MEKLSPYSQGFHGKVNMVTSPVFAGADFVKEEVNAAGLHYKLIYYSHLITNTLFPGTVVGIIGANTNEDGFVHRTYSRDAHVHPEHAVYSQHMSLGNGSKESVCCCPSCLTHRSMHAGRIDQAAKTRADQLRQYGIMLPWDDPSDYCASQNGQIVFFEIDGFQPDVLRRHLLSNGHSIQKKGSILQLLDRYEHLVQENVYYDMDPAYADPATSSSPS